MKLVLDGSCTRCGRAVPVTENTRTLDGPTCGRCRRTNPSTTELAHVLLQRRERLIQDLVDVDDQLAEVDHHLTGHDQPERGHPAGSHRGSSPRSPDPSRPDPPSPPGVRGVDRRPTPYGPRRQPVDPRPPSPEQQGGEA